LKAYKKHEAIKLLLLQLLLTVKNKNTTFLGIPARAAKRLEPSSIPRKMMFMYNKFM